MEQNQVAQAPATPPVTNNKLTTCKTCGAQIAKSAKKCPSCGAKNKSGKSLVKTLIPLIILGALNLKTPLRNLNGQILIFYLKKHPLFMNVILVCRARKAEFQPIMSLPKIFSHA